MPMVTAMSRAWRLRVVAVAHWHRRGHISVHRHGGVMRATAGARAAHPAATVFWTRLQRDPGDRDDHPEPKKSRQDTLCRRPPHGQQSMDRPGQDQRPETPRALHASKVPVSDPASSLRVAGSPQPVLASISCVCAKCNCGSWRWLSRWSNSSDRPQRRWPMHSSKRQATVRMPPRTSKRTGGRSAPGFMPAIARSANTSRPRSTRRHRRLRALRCPLRPSGRLSPNSSAMRPPHSARARILAGHRFSSSRTAFRARRSCDGARPLSLIGAL
jgi:hypothetical protein